MRRLAFFILSLFVLFSCTIKNSWSQTEPHTAKSTKVTIYVGETKRLPLDGLSPFIVDDKLLTLKELPPGQNIELTGIAPGTTQVHYWKEGLLQYFVVEVLISPVFGGSNLLTPTYRGRLPYFVYSLQNNSTFDQNGFYQSPAYGHSLIGTLPLSRGYLTSYTSFTHQSESRRLPTAGLIYQSQNLSLNMGPAGGQLSTLLSNFSSASVYGSSLALNWGGQADQSLLQNMTFFGGVSPQSNLLDFSVGAQTYGVNYSIQHQNPEQFSPNFANASFVTYQPQADDTFTVGGVMEGNLNLSDGISIGGGYAKGANGGYEALVNPVIKTPRSLTNFTYTYVEHGLRAPTNTTPVTSDQYTANFSTAHSLANQNTNLHGGLFYNKDIPRLSTTSLESTGVGGTIGMSKQFSFQKYYGLNYATFHSTSGGNDILVSSLSTSLSHPVTRTSSLAHSISYVRSDLYNASQGAVLSHLFSFEKNAFRSQSSVSANLTRGQSSQESVVFNQSLEMALLKASFITNFAYQKAVLRDGNHFFILNPFINYPLTNNQSFSFGGALALSEGSSSTMNGSLSLTYQRYLGPGIEPDPLWKRLLGKRRKSTVEGNVFLDNNYNSFLDRPDKGIAKVRLHLDNRRQVLTDEKGFYRFTNVKAGEHILILDTTSLKLDPKPEVPLKQTFTTDGSQSTILPVPLTFKRATLQVRFVLDTNNNGKIDLSDDHLLISRGFLKSEAGETSWFSTKFQGSALAKGIEIGRHVVGWDSMDLPENVEPIGPSEQKIQVTEYKEYPVTFFFRPIRSVRGQIVMAEEKPLPRGLIMQLGSATSHIDEQGYYWLKDLTPGNFEMKLKNLSQTYCAIDQQFPIPIQVHYGIFTHTLDIHLTTQCDKSKQQ